MGKTGRFGAAARGLLSCSDRLADELERAARCIREHDEFLVVAHEEPDGDAAGSILGMGSLLEDLGKRVVRYSTDGIPESFQFVGGADDVVTELPQGWEPEVTVLLDCSTLERTGVEEPERLRGDTLLVIDHHDTFDSGAADVILHDPDAAATGELVYRLVGELDAALTEEIAGALYAAIVTDTGSFRYSNTSRTTFRIAGELLNAGVDPWEITVELFESQPRRRVELLNEVLDTLELSSCGRLAFIRIDREMLGETDRAAELTDGFINYGRSIRGVEVSTQLRELEDGNWKVSFRSKGRVDVSCLAEQFGGGGHENAAAFRSSAEPEEIRRKLTATLTDLLEED